MTPKQDQKSDYWFFLALVSLVIFLLPFFATVSYSDADSQYSLLVSQSILENRTIRLDAYRQAGVILDEDYRLYEKDGHLYYYFPPGASLFSLPIVSAARLVGMDMTVPAHEAALQNLLSAILCAVTFLFLFGAIHHFLDWPTSLFIASVFLFGSSLISNLGTALWSSHFATTFAVVVLYLLTRSESDPSRQIPGVLVGTLLFAAYLSRPTLLIFILLIMAALFLQWRAVFWKAMAAYIPLLLLFIVFNWQEYGQILPDYYTLSRFDQSNQIWIPLYGHLLSPSRGLLIFSPFLALTLIGGCLTFPSLRQRPLFWLVVLWFSLHLMAVSRFNHWWGGWSFGPRLMTEVIPGLALLTAMVWQTLSQTISPSIKWAGGAGFVLLGCAAIYINSWQGLYNLNTAHWNMFPDNGENPGYWATIPHIDQYPEYLFDWRYPQFMASEKLLRERYLEFSLAQLHKNTIQLNPYSIGQTIDHTNSEMFALFAGWSTAKPEFRWSKSRQAIVVFFVENDKASETNLFLDIHAFGLGPQTILIWLNDHEIGKLTYREAPQIQTVEFVGHLLQPGVNQLRFDIPGARQPNTQDRRLLGLALIEMRIREAPY
jgi:hypothetical protein